MGAIRTRFAPSPTGYLHIGGARTALFNWLYAKRMDGVFVLRVEDTDHARNTQEATQAIFDGMKWLGMTWDEGPLVGGEFGPYFQSERDTIYDRYFQKLIDGGFIYEKDDAHYFRFDRSGHVTFQDIICGEISIDYSDTSASTITPDMVIKRSNGGYVFHFVNVVDDIEMRISHVIRGDDHLMNTPKHIQLFRALGAEPPVYGHIPLILNQDGSKMSKSSVGAALGDYMPQGFLPQAVVNFLALLGWSPKDNTEIFSLPDLIERFSLEAINRSAAKFDIAKCSWVNQQHILGLTPQQFTDVALPYCIQAGQPLVALLTQAIPTVQTKVQLLAEVPHKIAFFFHYSLDESTLAKIKPGDDAAMLALAEALCTLEPWDGHQAVEDMKACATALGMKKPTAIMFPARIALTGQAGGPDLSAVFQILGKESVIARIKAAATTFQQHLTTV